MPIATHGAMHITTKLLVMSLLWATAASAEPSCGDKDRASPDCVVVGKFQLGIGLGFGSRSNPVDTRRDIPLIIVPQVSYYGRRFFLDNLDLGFTLYENDTHTFNLVASPGYDRVFFQRRDLQNLFLIGNSSSDSASTAPAGSISVGTPPPPPSEPTVIERILARKRRVTYHAGPEWHFDWHGVTGQLDVLYEVTGEHDGTEIRTALAWPLFESAGTLTATAGATWKSNELVTYFYGERGIYEADAALNPFAKLSYRAPITQRWSFNALAHIEWLDSSIHRSPIIFETYVTTVYAGVFYSF